jgi:hypothetical protein
MNLLQRALKNFVFALVQDAPTRIQMNRYQLANLKWVRIPGGPVGQHRRQIVITNHDAVGNVDIVEGVSVDPATATLKGLTVWPQQSVTLFTNADIFIKADGAITEAQVLEVYYTGV